MSAIRYIAFLAIALIVDCGYAAAYTQVQKYIPAFYTGYGNAIWISLVLKLAIPALLAFGLAWCFDIWNKQNSKQSKNITVALCIIIPMLANIIWFFAMIFIFGAYI